MDKKRQLEIARKILEWRYRQVGTAMFMCELQDAAVASDIPDAEMREFFKALAAGMK